MRWELKSIGAWPVIKVGFFFHAIMGFLFGLLAVPLFMMFAMMDMAALSPGASLFSELYQTDSMAGLMIILPFMYAILGAIFGTITTLVAVGIYNLVARLVGGLEFTLATIGEVRPMSQAQVPQQSTASASPVPPPPPPPPAGETEVPKSSALPESQATAPPPPPPAYSEPEVSHEPPPRPTERPVSPLKPTEPVTEAPDEPQPPPPPADTGSTAPTPEDESPILPTTDDDIKDETPQPRPPADDATEKPERRDDDPDRPPRTEN